MKKIIATTFLLLFTIIIYGQEEENHIVPVSNTALYLWCLGGCILQEFIYWFELKHEIAAGNLPPALNSTAYWIITLLAISLFSGSSYLYFLYGEQGAPNFFTTAVFSAGFARLFKGAVSNAAQPVLQNPENKTRFSKGFSIKNYLMIK